MDLGRLTFDPTQKRAVGASVYESAMMENYIRYLVV